MMRPVECLERWPGRCSPPSAGIPGPNPPAAAHFPFDAVISHFRFLRCVKATHMSSAISRGDHRVHDPFASGPKSLGIGAGGARMFGPDGEFVSGYQCRR